jgi:hypothetical protein
MPTTNQLLREIEQVLNQFPEHAARTYEAELVRRYAGLCLSSADKREARRIIRRTTRH